MALFVIRTWEKSIAFTTLRKTPTFHAFYFRLLIKSSFEKETGWVIFTVIKE